MRLHYVAGLFVFLAALGCFCVKFNADQAVAQTAVKKSDAVEKVIVPFVTKHCVICHGPKKKSAGLTLHLYTDEKSILKDRKKWTEVARMVHTGEMPQEKQPRPDIKDSEAFLKAINDIFIAADSNGKRDPGRVTMRRLNRAEYNNTIRDLVGVDFKPAEDFPADDVGYGFDNIGDVLTISPVLMERYLAAAETITQQAILTGELPKPSTRTVIARFTEPSVPNPDKVGNFRAITQTKVPLHTLQNLTQDGEFKARIRGYGQQLGKEPVKIALTINGKQEKVFEVKAKNAKEAEVFEITLELKKGPQRMAAILLNEMKDPDGKNDRAFMLEKFQLEGPLDTRPASHRKIMAHKEGLEKREAAREILTRFASRAYRRPATKDEVERLLKFVDLAEKNKERWEAGVQLAIQAVLCSPKFLFRVELDARPDSADAHPIDDYQLASRLSYFLWTTMPDEELFDLAAKKQLHANLKPQVVRMLKDTKSYALVENFAVQWLQLRLLKNHAPDSKLFPDFDEPLRNAMAMETEMFFHAIIKEDRSILDLIDSNFTYMNERLARHYGIADTNGNRLDQKAITKPGTLFARKFGGGRKSDEFQRVTFADEERGGLLTHASILTITSNPTRTSPVKRGKWVLEQILGTPPPPPPPNVPELEEKGQLKGTLRERMEQHRKNPSCAGCHNRMDPPGFAFENYNAIGKFRTKDGEFPIDPSGVLPNGQTFKGPKELKQILMGKKELFSRALTEKMLTYGIGRGIEYYDKSAVDNMVTALAKNDFRFSTLIVEITTSDPFRMRRGKGQAE
jgi:Protein of unknown function (DUF1592)/Protein of unknown function (DUF1588)/Protein of unknown function (DUF1587)/Protein of unknown function (DUF1585)/Protein of unknown function (DUF1595)